MTYETCGKCLATAELHTVCGWCIDPAYDMRRPRCVSLAELNGTSCRTVYRPQERPWLLDDRPTQDFGDTDAVQIQPQRVRVALKKCKHIWLVGWLVCIYSSGINECRPSDGRAQSRRRPCAWCTDRRATTRSICTI